MLSQKQPAPTIAILLAGMIPEVKSRFEECLRANADFRTVGAARSGYEAVALALRSRPDLILLGCSVPDRVSIETLFYIAQRLPDIGIVMASLSGDPRFVEAAFAAGALGYISMATARDEELHEALRLAYDYAAPFKTRS